MTRKPLTILFSGMIASDPHQGGATWAVLQYVLGLQRLGHTVYFVEPIKRRSIQPADTPLAASNNAAYFTHVVESFSLQHRAALLADDDRTTVGMDYRQLVEIASRAHILINVSGMLTDRELIERIPVRVYLDLDPAFVQMWQAVQGVDMRFAAHTHFVTVGMAIGTPTCTVPTCGRDWITTLQPIVLEHWPAIGPAKPAHDAWTTIANFRGYGSIEHEGVHYGQKAHSLRVLFDLPRRTREKLLLALAIHPAEVTDLAALHANGWQLIDPAAITQTPDSYRSFIQQSKGEFGVAKSGYVASRCGWFSDRSVCYLASGRPVVAQETGFSAFLPTGRGLLSFRDVDTASAAMEATARDYAAHCAAARALAETHFDSDRVLSRLLQRLGVTA
jgi:hypothetical protein